MKPNEKIAILSQALSKHLGKLRLMGGMHSLSAREELTAQGYNCELTWHGFTQNKATISKPTEAEAEPEIARVMQEIISEEVAALRRYIDGKSAEAKELEDSVLNTTEVVSG